MRAREEKRREGGGREAGREGGKEGGKKEGRELMRQQHLLTFAKTCKGLGKVEEYKKSH